MSRLPVLPQINPFTNWVSFVISKSPALLPIMPLSKLVMEAISKLPPLDCVSLLIKLVISKLVFELENWLIRLVRLELSKLLPESKLFNKESRVGVVEVELVRLPSKPEKVLLKEPPLKSPSNKELV